MQTNLSTHDRAMTSADHPMPVGYLPLRDAAKWTGVSTRTMRRWLQVGLAGHQVGEGGKVLIRPIDIHAFLQAQRVGQTASCRRQTRRSQSNGQVHTR